MQRYYLGVDGGQSSTTALIADGAGRVIGYGRGGPCNHVEAQQGREKFMRALSACLTQAAAQANLDLKSLTFAATCLGFSGGAEDKDAYSRELIRSQHYKITHDAETALAGATAGEPGIVIIAGTGSMAFGRNAMGQSARAGGWGYLFGDEGGAFDIARRSLRAALRAEEGWGHPTTLLPMLLDATGAKTADALLHRFYANLDRPAIAALSVIATQAAAAGDTPALAILDEAASYLAHYVEGVHRQLFSRTDSVRVAFIGGTFRSYLYRVAFTKHVESLIDCRVTAPQFSPAAGALLHALQMDGNTNRLSDVPDSEK